VREAMHGSAEIALVPPGASLKDVILAMTDRPWGAACVVEPNGALSGLITDGDLRRVLTAHDDIRGLRAEDTMTRSPISIGPDATLGDALELMESRPRQISVL